MVLLPLVCVVGGPLVGLVVWLSFVPGDIDGTPLGVGILIALSGLLAFVGYSAFHGLTRRTTGAALAAIAHGLIVIVAPPVLGAFGIRLAY